MVRQGAAAAAGVAMLLLAQGASADVAEGTIETIDLIRNTFSIGGMTYNWSSMNTMGPDLQDLHEGDEVKIRYVPYRGGKKASVQRITLVKSATAAATSTAYRPVSDERLVNPEPENWLLLRGNYQGWMFSPLDQINSSNVKDLVPVWSYATGVDSGHEAPPIVNDGVMFVATPYDQLLALDARTGDLLWRYQRELPEGFGALHNTKRGVALYGDKVYMTGQDAVLIALDAKTGKVAWESEPVADWQQGYYMTMAPLIVNGKVMVGVSGGEFGVRGFIAAYDAESGKQVWKTYTVPGSGRARTRHLGRRHLAEGRRLGVDDRHLRSRQQPDLLGHRQRLALVRRSAARRQSVHRIHGGDRSRQRRDQGSLPVPLERFLGLGRDERADGGRLREGRQDGQRPDQAVA